MQGRYGHQPQRQWGYHPLLISLANTGEPLFLVNRSGNRPSHEGATERYNQAIDLCQSAGFKRVLLRGDTDFTQTKALDDWHSRGVQFIFGIDAMPNLVAMAESLENKAWKPLVRKSKRSVKTQPRQCPRNVKEAVVRARELKNVRLQSEDVAEFDYAPGKCRGSYRFVVIRKNLSVERGESVLFDDVRYFFYITNNRSMTTSAVVRSANGRCNQEKLIGQLKGGVRALDMPVDNLVSNCAYIVMASRAWSLKIWFALSLPEHGRWRKKYKSEKDEVLRMEFQTFLNAFMRIPAQVISTGRRIVYRVLTWNQWLDVFFRGADAIGRQVRRSMRCRVPPSDTGIGTSRSASAPNKYGMKHDQRTAECLATATSGGRDSLRHPPSARAVAKMPIVVCLSWV